MSKYTFVNVEMHADEYGVRSDHYSKMGFELVHVPHYKGIGYSGSVNGSDVRVFPHPYDYYKCLYRFNLSQKNAKQLWRFS